MTREKEGIAHRQEEEVEPRKEVRLERCHGEGFCQDIPESHSEVDLVGEW